MARRQAYHTDGQWTETVESGPGERPDYMIAWPAERITADTITGLATAPDDCCHLLGQLLLIARGLRRRPGLAAAVAVVLGTWGGVLPANASCALGRLLDCDPRQARRWINCLRQSPILSQAVVWRQHRSRRFPARALRLMPSPPPAKHAGQF
jgi:hypothetical protein